VRVCVHIHVSVLACRCASQFPCAHVCVRVVLCVHVCVRVCVCAREHSRVHTCMCGLVPAHTCVRVCICVQKLASVKRNVCFMHVRENLCVHVSCMCICRMHVCENLCVHVGCMCVCRVGQNHTFIGVYGVHTVFSAGKSPYIRSYTVHTYGSGQPCVYAVWLKVDGMVDGYGLPLIHMLAIQI